MQKKKIEKIYIKKINELKKHDEAYFKHDSPLISDKDYDDIREEILDLEKLYFLWFFVDKSPKFRYLQYFLVDFVTFGGIWGSSGRPLVTKNHPQIPKTENRLPTNLNKRF